MLFINLLIIKKLQTKLGIWDYVHYKDSLVSNPIFIDELTKIEKEDFKSQLKSYYC